MYVLLLFHMVRPTDQERTAIEKIICFKDARSKGHTLSQGELYRESPGWSEVRELGQNMSKSLYCSFHRKEGVRQIDKFRIG